MTCGHVDRKGRLCIAVGAHRLHVYTRFQAAKRGVRFERPLRRHPRRGYAQVWRWVMARANDRCEARFIDECSGRADHAHHILPRSQGGKDELGNLIAVCAACHRAIHDHPVQARSAGYLRPHWPKAPDVDDETNPTLRGRLDG